MNTVPKLRAYQNCTYTKQQAVALMQEHRRLDHIIQGTYGHAAHDGWVGCLVGCATQGDHFAFEVAFGIPESVAVLADRIFERQADDTAANFAVEFFEVIQAGADLSTVPPTFSATLIRQAIKDVPETPEREAVAHIASLFEKEAGHQAVTDQEWSEARARAIDLALDPALDLALDLDRALALELALDLDRALACALDLDRALAVDRDLAFALDLDLKAAFFAALSSASAADTAAEPAALADDHQAVPI